MLKKIRSKALIRQKSILKKLKKWRFWKVFKYYFLRSKKKNYFTKISWFYNQRRIIWHHFMIIYGKKIKNLAYTNNKSKKIFNTKFGSILCKLELRLNVLVLRIGFVNKLQQANYLISNSKILINSIKKHKNYFVRIKNIISFSQYLKIRDLKRFKKIRWRRLKWNKWKKQYKNKKFRYIFYLLKKNFTFNFMEVNYYYYFSILLKIPSLGEISYSNKKKFLTLRLLQKIYFLY